MTDLSSSRGGATIRVSRTDAPSGVLVEGRLDRSNARLVAAELRAIAGPDRRRPIVVDLTRMVFEDCTGVRVVREAIRTLAGEGYRLAIRTSDPVARLSFDVARVA